MPALQHFILDHVKGLETCADILSVAKHFSCMLIKKHFVQNILGAAISLYGVIMISIKDWLRQVSRSVIY